MNEDSRRAARCYTAGCSNRSPAVIALNTTELRVLVEEAGNPCVAPMVTAGQVWWRAELICLRKMFSPQHRGTTTTTAYKVEADVLLTWHIELDPIAGCNHSDIYYKPKVASGLFVNSCFDFSLTFSGIFLNSGFNITTSHYDNQQRARRSSGAEMIRISTSCLP